MSRSCQCFSEEGFTVQIHHDCFYGRQDVSDPEIIEECGKRGWYLLTGDGNLCSTYPAEVMRAQIGVFVLSNNHDGPEKWGPRIVAAKASMIRATQRRARPFVARLNTSSRLTLKDVELRKN